MSLRVAVFILLLCSRLVAAGQSKGVPLMKLPPQTIDLADLKLPSAAQACTSYAIAIGIEAMLRVQKVALDQHFWVQKANGGEACVDPLPDLDRLSRDIDGTYTLDDGRKVTLETHIIAGAPTIPDDTIAPLKRGIPLLFLWKGHAYVLHGVVYDEYVYPNGQRMFQITELKMTDPLAPAKEREISFKTATDDPAEITAIIRVSAGSVEGQSWNRPTEWHKPTNWIPKKEEPQTYPIPTAPPPS